MAGIRHLLAQTTSEYGALIAGDAFSVARELASTSGTEFVLIGLGILVVLYMLTRLM